MPSLTALRHAPWSLSKVKSALRCPLEFHYRYVDNISEREVFPEARIGKAVHAALERLLTGAPVAEALAGARRELLSEDEERRFDEHAEAVGRFGERMQAFRARRRVRVELVEHRLAVTSDLSPTGFVAPDAFFRGIWDAGFLFDDGVLAVVDHKTGVRRTLVYHADQLEGYATLAATHMPAVQRIWLGVHFVRDAAMEWAEPIDVPRVKSELVPKVLAQIEQAAREVAAGPTPRPGEQCPRCSYRSICPAMRGQGPPEPEPVEPEDVEDR